MVAHEHNYQRWLPLDAGGQVSDVGVTQFVVGTGGHNLESFALWDSRVGGGAEYVDGALRLELGATGATYAFIAIDGTVLDSGSIPCDVSGLASLSRTSSKPDGRVDAELSHMTPNSGLTLRWEDGMVLGEGQTDNDGNAVVTFRTPIVARGSYQVTAEDAEGRTALAQLTVIPRVTMTTSEVPAGTDIQANLAGFSANEAVELRLTTSGDKVVVILGSAIVAKDGSAAAVVTIPPDLTPGEYRLRAAPIREGQGSASASIQVITGTATPGPAP